MAEKYFTVSGLTLLIKTIVEDASSLRGIWVRGEITNLTHQASGHMYFALKDAGARLRCVMFRSQNRTLRFKPTDGLEVLARGSIAVYERNGDYQLYVETLEPAGLGSLHLAFIQLKERLAREGLFDRARKRPLPVFPRRVALVTSPTGAAVRDMIEILRQRQPGLDILVVPVLVQGTEAASSIAAGLAAASILDELDLVVVGRGGGSPEELWPFNEEIVVRAIAACRHPVISAVGHEIDVTIADFAADARAATPSAAAEMAVPDGRILLRTVAALERRLAVDLRGYLAMRRAAVARFCASQVFLKPARILSGSRQALDETWRGMERAIQAQLARQRERLLVSAGKIDSLSPLATLGRGYAICRLPGGEIVRHAGAVEPGGEVQVILGRGWLQCLVRSKEDARG